MTEQQPGRTRMIVVKAVICLLAGFAAGYAVRTMFHRRAEKKERGVNVVMLRHRAIGGALKSGSTSYTFVTDFSPPLAQQ